MIDMAFDTRSHRETRRDGADIPSTTIMAAIPSIVSITMIRAVVDGRAALHDVSIAMRSI